jgi:hypothetical protein
MARTVGAAFDDFRANYVDLDPEEVKTARRSRDFLVEQIYKIPDDDPTFPWLTKERILFGSFARRTKICPLDDIDIMIQMHGGGGYEVQDNWERYLFKVNPATMPSPVRYLVDDTGYINSNRVLLKFRNALADMPFYEKAEINKRGEAVTLTLRSYPWTFDIVPTFGVTDQITPVVYYLIPNGSGQWKRTDPRRDDRRLTAVNQKHDELAIPTIRMLKYWNRRSQIPTMMSYWLETIALSVFEELSESMKIDRLGLCWFFIHGECKVAQPCPDPKGLGPDLDADVDLKTKAKLVQGFRRAAEISVCALDYELNKQDHAQAIIEWQKLFGPEFK